MASVTYTKLRDGSWGIRIAGYAKPQPGASVIVKTKAGVDKPEVVDEVKWSGQGKDGEGTVSICSVRAKQAPSQGYARRGCSYQGRRTGCSCGSIEGQSRDSDCWQCRHDAE